MKKDILFWKIGYCSKGPYGGRLIIPSFNYEGNINYFIARSYERNILKYKNPPCSKNNIVFNHLYLDFKKPITIVEKENKIADLLKKYDIIVHKIDTSEYKDAGEMPKSVFLEKKSNATVYSDFNSLINRLLYAV